MNVLRYGEIYNLWQLKNKHPKKQKYSQYGIMRSQTIISLLKRRYKTMTTTNNTRTDGPSVYIGTYAKYNNGSIAGAWLNLDFGYYIAEQTGLDIPEQIAPYFDYEAYGRDVLLGYTLTTNYTFTNY